ncbi:hypothetical protein PR202_gb06657 [Eleusine coracana subsp. coracana]|uniref:Reverse transcriptase zinc-binding domain-containing protein n=1 Tax=Eleusine coracana subsp. coracana TaxID=191504 RepID=A0AAV5EA56_ELECO|nr:hypothetical protein PR202_gb06657 [Eleusine coracana subsp. coracana]
MCADELPQGMFRAMDSLCRGFFWAGESKAFGAQCLVGWDKVTRPHDQGGLGIRDLDLRKFDATLDLQNSCLLLKLIHRLYTANDSSWAAWVNERVDISTMTGDIEGSHWSTLQRLLPVYQSITTVTIGNGTTTSIWHDHWLECGRLTNVYPALASHAATTTATVARVLADGVRAQLVPRLSRLAAQELEEVQEHLQRVRLSSHRDTRCSELFSPDGTLKTSALYKLVMCATYGPGCSYAKFIWDNRASPKVQFFGWLMVQERVQCKTNLLLKNIVNDDQCEVCANGAEDTGHIFYGCSFAQSFWNAIGIQCRIHPLRRHGSCNGPSAPLRSTAIASPCCVTGSFGNIKMKWSSDQHTHPFKGC